MQVCFFFVNINGEDEKFCRPQQYKLSLAEHYTTETTKIEPKCTEYQILDDRFVSIVNCHICRRSIVVTKIKLDIRLMI